MKTRFLARARANATATGELYIYDEISYWGVTAAAVKAALEELRAAGTTELHLFINSPGGDVFEGVAIYNLLRRFAGKKTVHIDGLAASMASVIALAGDHIICGMNAMVMIHDPWAFAMGSAPELREKADTLDKIAESMLATYVERTGQAAADVKRWMRDETWMTAAEAKERGFVHEIADEKKDDGEKALLDASAFGLLEKYRKTPAPLRARLAIPPPGDPRPEPDATSVTEPSMKSLAKHLGLNENATEAEILAALMARDSKATSDSAALAQILSVTGKANAAEAAGAVAAWKQGAEQVPVLNARVQALEAEKVETQVVALVDEAVKAGKATPAQRDALLSMGRTSATMLKGFLEAAPVIAPSAVNPPKTPPTAAISEVDAAVAKQLNIDPKSMASDTK